MKKVLLTNYSITHFSGSELDTLEVANYFLNNNYDVTIFTLEYGYPLLKEINNKIKVIDYDNLYELDDFYDIIWAHHFPLLDYLLLKKKIKSNYIHYVSLSSYMEYEAIPSYYQDLTLVSTISKEALESLRDEGFDISCVNIFSNYATEDYFKETVHLKKLKKICIISNHIPPELLEFKDIARDNDYIVDIYGIGYIYKRIDKKILKQYDLVISIGKTINYSLALGIPCYCYDRFGGDLYINKSNISKSYEYNFSGRYSKIKLTGKDLYEDIIKNYEKVLIETNELKEFAYDNFCLENMISKILKEFKSKDKFNINKFLEKNKKISRGSSLFVNEMGMKNHILKNYLDTIDLCQIYYDTGKGFNESESIIKNYIRVKPNIYKVSIEIPNDYQKIRIDYTNKIFIHLKYLKVNNVNYLNYPCINTGVYKKGLLSLNDDPGILINKNDLKSNRLNIELEMEEVNSLEVIKNLKKIKLRKKFKLGKLIKLNNFMFK